MTGPLSYTWETLVDGDVTPAISGGSRFKTANTAPTTITDFDGVVVTGQSILVLFTDALTKIQDLSNGSNIRLEGAIEFTGKKGDKLVLQRDGDAWVEIGRYFVGEDM